MPSAALTEWRTTGLARLAELEAIHFSAAGGGRGRRWGTTQLNRSLFVALVAQFQSYCVSLHDQAVAVHARAATPAQALVVETLLVQGRKLDTQNPRVSALGSDFGRLGFSFVEHLKLAGTATQDRLRRLDTLVDFRNAIGHGNETQIATLVATGKIAETKQSYVSYRRALNALAGTMDKVLAAELAALLQIPKPW